MRGEEEVSRNGERFFYDKDSPAAKGEESYNGTAGYGNRSDKKPCEYVGK